MSDPIVGHEQFRGMLAIPYLRRATAGDWSVVSIRFRCIRPGCEHAGHGKYNTLSGDRPRLYNTVVVVDNDDEIAITEGELDAISSSMCGLPAVSVPGASSWRSVWAPAFLGYETVYILADNDELKPIKGCPRCKSGCRGHNWGMEFAQTVAKDLPNSKIVPMPLGEDVNSTVLKHGKAAFLAKLGRKELNE